MSLRLLRGQIMRSFYLQILDDMAVQRKRIQKKMQQTGKSMQLCVTTLPETLGSGSRKRTMRFNFQL